MNVPDELSLLSLFECEPKLADASLPYFYNEATYEFFNQSQEKFIVSICPSYSDIKIQVYSVENNDLISNIDLKTVDSIEILSDKKDKSSILVKMEKGSIRIEFKPRFKAFLDYANYA